MAQSSPGGRGGLQAHTASTGSGIEPGIEFGSRETGHETLHQVQVHPAGELRVLAGEGVKRAVGQGDATRIGAGLEATLDQDIDGRRP